MVFHLSDLKSVWFPFDDSRVMSLQLDLDLTNYSLDHYDVENCFNGHSMCIFCCLIAGVHGKTLFPFRSETHTGLPLCHPALGIKYNLRND